MKKAAFITAIIILLALGSGCANVTQVTKTDLSDRLFRLSREYYASGEDHLKRNRQFSAAKDFLIAAELDDKFYAAWDKYFALQPVLQDDSRDWGEEVEFPANVPSSGWSLVKYEAGKKLMELGEYERARAIFINDLELCDCLPPPFEEWKPHLKSVIEECDRHIDSHPESK